MRKILNNRRKSNRLNGTTKGRIGTLLPIADKHNNQLAIGDTVTYDGYKGILLYNHYSNECGIALDYSMWYGENPYNIDSYGKFVKIPMDNGGRMEIEKTESFGKGGGRKY